jgi:outer membrane receptor protein involved in Fe transport
MGIETMRMKLLAATVLAALAGVNGASAQTADQTAPPSKDTEKLQTVTVTGSLIPQAQIETASPVITISASQIEKQGFATIYDALRASPVATGAVLDNQFTGGFTPGAETISLLGLDPSFTLTLINGHPMADYPLLYNGVSNFVDLANLPIGMIDHIDILPGNQSSIYGSAAIAGVVNIVLKDHMDGYELNVRSGGYSDGGGASQRIEFLGSASWGDLQAMYGLQVNRQNPIWSYQRSLTASTNSSPNPNTRYGTRNFLYLYLDSSFAAHYVDPGADTCTPLAHLNGGRTNYDFRPGEGYFCGSRYNVGYSTILNDSRGATAYLNLKYKLNDSAELYGDILYNVSRQVSSAGPYFWESSIATTGLFVNADTGRFESVQHIFSPEEVGNVNDYEDHNFVRTYNAFGGVRGAVGRDNQWQYDLYYARSQTNVNDKQGWPLAGPLEAFFTSQIFGEQLGTTGPYPIYGSPNLANLYKPVTPEQYATWAGFAQTRSEAWTQNLNVQINNTDLFSMPAGQAGVAALLQVGDQAWNNPVDPRITAGDFYGLTGTSGSGTRNNYAGAIELRLPLLSTLTADASVRYDHYGNQNVGGGDAKPTYKLGLEYRPVETLLLRGNYATAFRAPDMAYTFGGEQGFFQTGQTDYYLCATQQPNTPLPQCTYYTNTQIFVLHHGNADLKSVTAKSFGLGAVWSPLEQTNLKVDYYNIRIANEVSLQSSDTLLRQESDCRLGNLDPNSPTCQAALAQVTRNSAGGLSVINLKPINIANEHLTGIYSSVDWRHDFGRWGSLQLQSAYNVILHHYFQTYPEDPTLDYLREPYYSSEFKTIANASATWAVNKFSSTLLVTRYGRTPNYLAGIAPEGYGHPGAGTVAPWIIYNGSIAYDITDDIRISGIVNNLFNKKPPFDSSYAAYPYYNFTNFNPYGRAYWLEVDWKFGRSNG